MVKEWICGTLDGRPVKEFEITDGALCLRVMEYGATVHQLLWNGTDMVAGYDDLTGYVKGTSFQGATVGRYANRIGGACFCLQNEIYRLEANDGGIHSLHGGTSGFYGKLFTGEVVKENSVAFSLFSPHNEGGYPGNLHFTVTFTLADDGVTIVYDGLSDRDTVMNFTNHSYFHLGAADNKSIVLQILGDAITPVDEGLIPTGQRMDVTGTPFDFRTPKAIGADLEASHPQLRLAGGYDHNYILGNTRGYRENVITAHYPAGGVTLTCSTDLPGVQLYTANMLDEPAGKGGKPLCRHGAFCLETQFFPDSPHHPDFPSCVVKAQTPFRSVTRYAFKTE